MSADIDTEYTRLITCPHCGYEIRNSWEMHDGVDETEIEVDCPECDAIFDCTVHVEVEYSTWIKKYSTNMMPYDDSEGEEA